MQENVETQEPDSCLYSVQIQKNTKNLEIRCWKSIFLQKVEQDFQVAEFKICLVNS